MKNNLYYVMNQYGKDLVEELKKRLQEDKKIASGDLLKSLGYELSENSDGWSVKIISNATLKYVDAGRKPGSKMPPSDKLVPWVESKGIKIGTSSNESAAFVIARSIGIKGIKPTNIIKESMDTIYENYKQRITDATIKDMKEEAIKNLLGQ